ncbi:hypothetical protein L484_001905 [Morus notabilis]|uniref:Uncharacterized protein n=1 Tax=Morus notabilis TaxID=981085 RepID=W9R397_9ROSA|nr:hypothetical protein L484_001905 [Morus notabilis]
MSPVESRALLGTTKFTRSDIKIHKYSNTFASGVQSHTVLVAIITRPHHVITFSIKYKWGREQEQKVSVMLYA